MRPTVLLALALAFALVTGCASPARESSGSGDDASGKCSGNVCRDTIEVTGPDGAGNSTNQTNIAS